LLELRYADPDKASQYQCSKCPASVKRIRRCAEPRWDFSDVDGAIWPMRLIEGGELYPFCPGKATWDSSAVNLFQALVICAETGSQIEGGGIWNQPSWWIDMAAEFLPRYNDLRFNSRARAILGDGKGKGASNGAEQVRSRVQHQAKHK
jgi:hypothetical protein